MAKDKAIVSGVIKIPLKEVTGDIIQAYSYTKPNYNGGMPEIVENYYETKDELWLPRNLKKFKSLCSLPLKYKLSEGKPINTNWNDGYNLYQHQKVFHDGILKHLKSDVNCLAVAPTRFGKSSSAFGVISSLKVNTIILVDKTLLVNQFVDDINEYGNANVGILDKSEKLYDITVATFQFLNANPKILKSISKEFGMLIVDELHVSAATTYKRIIQSFNTRYRLGLTATPTRSSDGLTGVLTDLFGETAVTGVNPDDMSVSWYNHRLSKTYKPSSFNPSASYNKYYLDPSMVKEIISLILYYHKQDRTIMIATSSQKVQNHYTELLKTMGITTCVFNSEASNKKKQDKNLELVKSGNIRVFSGLNVLLKGVSIPRLSVVFNLMAIGSSENLAQLLGRLKTKYEDKPAPLFINVNPKWATYKTDKITELLEDMENVIHEK